MLKTKVLLSALVVGVALPAAARAQLPQVPEVPQVPQVPDVPQVPEVPQLPAPELPDPSPLPDPPPLPAPAPEPELPAPTLPSPGSGGAGGSSGGGGGGGGASTGAGAGGGSTSSAGGGGGSAARAATGPSGGPARSGTRAARVRAERRLRRTVVRLGGCLDDLPGAHARVLRLRAGIGAGPPRSRRGVARLLDVRVRRVVRLERRGLRTARTLARTDGCGGRGSTTAAAGGPPMPSLPGGPSTGGDTTFAEAPQASAGPGTAGGAGEQGSAPNGGGRDSGDVRGESSELIPPGFGDGRESVTGTSLWVAAGLMLLAAVAGFATPALRERLREPTSRPS